MTNTFTKIDADGTKLPQDADAWQAVLDSRTGLMWSVAEQRVDNHAAAIEAATKVAAGGFSDWRLPSVEELFLLADRSRSRPAIDTEYFPDCKSGWYWTGTLYAPSPGDCAWGVYFYGGYTYWDSRDNDGFVRAVRGGQ